MLKMIKKLVKRTFKDKEKYILFYQTNIFGDYKLDFCTPEQLEEKLRRKEMYSYFIFLRKDELEVKTEIDFNFNEE